MLMLSQLTTHLINVLANYRDIPCVLESPTRGEDGKYVLPLNDVAVMIIGSTDSPHKEAAVVFTSTNVESFCDSLTSED